MTRVAKHKGSFYSDNCQEIINQINRFTDIMMSALPNKNFLNYEPRAIISPHAGYIYSGFTANIAHKLLANTTAKRIIVIGPSHYVGFNGISGSFYDRYETPCGYLAIDKEYLEIIKNKFNIKFVTKTHQQEHSTETQMPLIKHYHKDKKIIELIYGKSSNLANLIKFLLKDKDNALVISTDLSHFHTLKKANQIDKNCLDGVYNQDLNLLKKCEACGYDGLIAMVQVAKEMKLNIELLDYRTSYDYSKDKNRVVGYMSAVVL